MGNRKSALALAIVGISVSGCNSVRTAWADRAGNYTRNMPDLSDYDARAFAERQNNLWNCFVAMAQAAPGQFRHRDNFKNEPTDYACPNVGAAPNKVKSTGAAAATLTAAVPEPDLDDQSPPTVDAPVENGSSATDATGKPMPGDLEETRVAVSPFTLGSDRGVPAYSEVVAAGINYVDVRCDRFIDALFWFNRVRETSSRQIQYVGAASAAALTILKASEQLIGLAPLGIGLFDQTVNNIGRGLLYELPPHAVRQLVEKQQQAYLAAVSKEYTSRPHAMQTIQGYAALCLPATIETEVNRAIAAAEYKPIEWENPRYDWTKKPALQDKTAPGGKPEEPETTEGTPPPNNVPAVEQTGDDD